MSLRTESVLAEDSLFCQHSDECLLWSSSPALTVSKLICVVCVHIGPEEFSEGTFFVKVNLSLTANNIDRHMAYLKQNAKRILRNV